MDLNGFEVRHLLRDGLFFIPAVPVDALVLYKRSWGGKSSAQFDANYVRMMDMIDINQYYSAPSCEVL